MTRAAVYTGTRNLYGGMIAASKSLIANSDVEEVWLLIEDDEFPVDLPEIVHTMDISEKWKEFYDPKGPNMLSEFTYMAMIRPVFCHLFPHLDKILSLDVDTFVRQDVSELWRIDLDGYYWAGCLEPHHSRDGIYSINAGVTLMNFEMLRDGRADIIADCLNVHQLHFVDQDAMTCLCQGHILPIDKKFNGTKWCGCGETEAWIRHYAGEKGWYNYKEPIHWYHKDWGEVLEMHERVVEKWSSESEKAAVSS